MSERQAPRVIAGVDVGGTFTDLFFLDEATGRSWTAKVPSTRGAEAEGFLAGLAAGGATRGLIGTIVHGTTVGTNALLERKGGPAGLITTAGFRDVLEMRRRDRPATWGLRGNFDPVIARNLRVEVAERTRADGTVLEAPDPEAIAAAARLLRERGAKALAIAFINAHANPANETLAAAAARAAWPDPHVTVATEILPEIREFERSSTAAINAYLQPLVAEYLDRLETAMAEGGLAERLLIVQSNGGAMTAAEARAFPARTALSGPAAGVVAAAHLARAAGIGDVVTGDVGGTSFDVSLIAGGETALAPQTSIGFGMVVRLPMVEITTIGAGGGSIATVDAGGLLRVGPESAGSVPGPACYGSGTRATVTDANVLLGRIDASRPIGGRAQLDVAAAREAIGRDVGAPLGLDPLTAAEAILRVANSRMAGAIRLVSIERGHDPRRFTLMPFGGGGGLHAGALIREVGLARALIPRFPGVTSALGCVIADLRRDVVVTVNTPLDALDVARVEDEIARRAADGHAALDAACVLLERRDLVLAFDMLYQGQTHTIRVPCPWTGPGSLSRQALAAAFATQYATAYGRTLPGIPPRVLNLHVAVIGRRPFFDLASLAPTGGSLDAAMRGTRRVYADGAWHEAAIYARLDLPADAVIAGPAVLEQPDTTIFVDPGMVARADRLGNIVLERAR
jgi:N-methylhydantoinase A